MRILCNLPASCPLDDLGAFVLGDHALHLEAQAIFGALADRVLDKVQLHPASLQLLDQDVLMHVVPSEPIGAVHEHDIEQPIGRCVAQGIQTRSGKS